MRVLVFGDSITYGAVDTQGGWASRVRRHFDEKRATDKYSRDYPNIYNLGISGDTAEDILGRFDIETEARKRIDDELVFILAVGTNDSSLENGKPRYTPEQFKNICEKAINKMQKHSQKIIIVGLLPVDEKLTTPIPWRLERHYTNKQVLLFDEVIKNVAKARLLPYVHLYETFKNKLDLFPDGLHPNDEGHELIASLVLPELEKLLA